MSLELVAIVGVVLVVAVSVIAPRVGVAAPLLLVVLGVAVTFLPFVDRVTIPPEWILGGILPPLLYSTAVNTPSMEFRRDFRLISLFSVILVVITSVLVGLLACALAPGLPLGIGIALGAIVSPTDAVATSVIRQAGVPRRIVTVLEGESLLNDASALVLLRSAVAAIGVSISVWEVGLDFLWAVAAAVAIGWVVGRLNLAIRARITQVTSNVTLSLVVPFLAYLPAEHLEASGLVATVTAGLVTGYGAPRRLGAEERIAERTVWRTVELLLESAVFLLVGLEAPSLAADVVASGGGLGLAVLVAVLAATCAIAVRSGFVAWSLWTLARRNRRAPEVRDRLTELQDQIAEGKVPDFGASDPHLAQGRGDRRPSRRKARRLERRAAAGTATSEERIGRWQQMLRKRVADLDYLAAEKLGWREGVMLVWAGMRGAVTIAAAQTLPSGTPHRSLLILVATLVALGTLLIQGSTLGWLATKLGLTGAGEVDPGQWEALQAELNRAAFDRLASGRLESFPPEMVEKARERIARAPRSDEDDFRPGSPAVRARMEQFRTLRLDLIAAQRDALLDLRDLGAYPSTVLDAALAQLDADQIGIELHQH
ncbi:MAG: sodium:proton antiporter [Propionicimonas sp.]|uniref:cation:proton antiporter n=1 Tax=Propionicimonas sp. TaxID=1955623 RepID=UPI003D0E3365